MSILILFFLFIIGVINDLSFFDKVGEKSEKSSKKKGGRSSHAQIIAIPYIHIYSPLFYYY